MVSRKENGFDPVPDLPLGGVSGGRGSPISAVLYISPSWRVRGIGPGEAGKKAAASGK